MNPTQRITTYTQLTPVFQELYGSEKTIEINIRIRETYGLLGETYRKYINVVGDTILGFYQTKDLPTLLQTEAGIGADTAQRIVIDLAEFLAPVLEREMMLTNPKQAAMKDLHQQFSKPTTELKPITSQPIIAGHGIIAPTEVTTPEETHNVTPMRTMANDINRIHGYGAYRQVGGATDETIIKTVAQDDLLKDRPRLTNIPKVGE